MTIKVQSDNGLRIIKELEMNPYLFIQDKKTESPLQSYGTRWNKFNKLIISYVHNKNCHKSKSMPSLR